METDNRRFVSGTPKECVIKIDRIINDKYFDMTVGECFERNNKEIMEG